MAPTPLIAPYRLTFRYTVSGLQHRTHYYLDCTPSGDPMGFDTVARPGFSPVGVSTVEPNVFGPQAPFYNPSTCSFDDMILEINVSGAWVFVASMAASGNPTGSGTQALAAMETWSGKDQANQNFPVYWFEKPFNTFAKFNSYAGLSSANKAIANAYFNPGGVAVDEDPVAWRLSRGAVYSQRWLALVTDSSQKLRRIRGIA